MSDHERGKYYNYNANKKKYSRHDAIPGFGSRFFNSKRSDGEFSNKEKEESKDSKTVKAPTILLKAREREDDRSLSPKRQGKDGDSTPITIATSSETTPPVITKQMHRSVNLLEDGDIFIEHVNNYLEENNDFLVVGIVGMQAVGKSSILNLLANKNVTEKLKKTLFGNESEIDDDDSIENVNMKKTDESKSEQNNLIFDTQSAETLSSNVNCTQGIDLFINQNRVIFLDCQPFLSASILDKLMMKDDDYKRSCVMSVGTPIENTSEINCLQYTAFLMSVCHVLIFVQDWFLDSNAIRFIQTAEMLKPTILNQEEEYVDHFPHFIILHNRATLEDFQPNRFETMQNFYRMAFNKSKLHLDSGMGLANGRIIPYLNPENCGECINLYLLPEYEENDEDKVGSYKGYTSFDDLITNLRANILSCSKNPLTHYALSEKTWLTYAAKVWDHVKKSSFFVEYAKLMP